MAVGDYFSRRLRPRVFNDLVPFGFWSENVSYRTPKPSKKKEKSDMGSSSTSSDTINNNFQYLDKELKTLVDNVNTLSDKVTKLEEALESSDNKIKELEGLIERNGSKKNTESCVRGLLSQEQDLRK